MCAVTSRTLEVANGRFHLLEWNAEGPPVLLLHGFNQTAHSWEELAERASDELHLIALDQRGHGASMRAADGDYSREAMTRDALQVADALGLAEIALVGMSMGATHAISFAVQKPQRVRALVIVDYAPEVERAGVDKIELMLARSWPRFEDAVREAQLFNPRRSEENIRARLSHSLARRTDGSWSWRVDPAFAGQARFSEPPEVMWQLTSRVSCPALVVRGAQSDLLSEETARRMARALPRGELTTVAGAGHSVAGDNPAGFYEAVMPFLRAAFADQVDDG